MGSIKSELIDVASISTHFLLHTLMKFFHLTEWIWSHVCDRYKTTHSRHKPYSNVYQFRLYMVAVVLLVHCLYTACTLVLFLLYVHLDSTLAAEPASLLPHSPLESLTFAFCHAQPTASTLSYDCRDLLPPHPYPCCLHITSCFMWRDTDVTMLFYIN